ncbi:DsrE family protein [Arsenophonus nasoniae]|nr:DsrE family protein [Arsenophonus nasoniae]QBY44873.1 DsrE/DsrF-like family protein [Arsenophonus nasoniae]WGL94573.1 DsrE family protein [Arsenophonus nasoniae]WGM01031.1 DsrE family protein [Arsenophonus nasoniae]WGM05119.1 DsrE family protein [Arsenophonus nasoniae]WGM10131.1 DsrE family protein [Arsenophonus nasoniae]
MQEKKLFLIIANGAAYGDENLFNALRLAIAVKEQAATTQMKIFLMSDAVVAGLINQKPVEGYNLKQMLEILLAQQVEIKLCKTCTDARGITELPLIKGITIGTLIDLAEWTLASNKVLTF